MRISTRWPFQFQSQCETHTTIITFDSVWQRDKSVRIRQLVFLWMVFTMAMTSLSLSFESSYTVHCTLYNNVSYITQCELCHHVEVNDDGLSEYKCLFRWKDLRMLFVCSTLYTIKAYKYKLRTRFCEAKQMAYAFIIRYLHQSLK